MSSAKCCSPLAEPAGDQCIRMSSFKAKAKQEILDWNAGAVPRSLSVQSLNSNVKTKACKDTAAAHPLCRINPANRRRHAGSQKKSTNSTVCCD